MQMSGDYGFIVNYKHLWKLTLGHSVLIMHLETNQRWCLFCSFSLLINERDEVPDKCSYYVLFI